MILNGVSSSATQSVATTNTFTIPATSGNALILCVIYGGSSISLNSITTGRGQHFTIVEDVTGRKLAYTTAYSGSETSIVFSSTIGPGGSGAIAFTAYDVTTPYEVAPETNPTGFSGNSSNPSFSYAYPHQGLAIAMLSGTLSVTGVSSPWTLEGGSYPESPSAYNLSGIYSVTFTVGSGSWTGNIANFYDIPEYPASTQIGYFLVGI